MSVFIESQFAGHSLCASQEEYQQRYLETITHKEAFWENQAKHCLTWDKPWTDIYQGQFEAGTSQWFVNGQLNVAVNCLDRHLATQAEQTAIQWVGEEPGVSETLSYGELHARVCQLANGLIQLGIEPGDRVCIYMPMIPELIISMLACARIGAIHSVVFGGFSAEALNQRLNDASVKLVITADEAKRQGKTIPLKTKVDEALKQCQSVECVLVVQHTDGAIHWTDKDIWMHELLASCSCKHTPQAFDAEHPLFILYTSGSTGQPKGILHTSAGYLLHATLSFRWIFDYRPQEVFWCTADAGWITGHTYLTYGPLSNGATVLMYEGNPSYPTPARLWEIVDEHQVNILYTAPTLIRSLMAEGNAWLAHTKRDSLRVLGSVGEPINPEAWQWLYHQVGRQRCPIVDTWWQTETGGAMITPIAGITPLKPGSATRPFLGIQIALLDDDGEEIIGAGWGKLAIKGSWPSQMRGIYNDQSRFIAQYLQPYPGYYLTGDGAKRDEDGNYWISGRLDDVVNMSGHRIGTAEVESVVNALSDIAESAVIGLPHAIKGECLVVFATLNKTNQLQEEQTLKIAINQAITTHIGSFCKADLIFIAPDLPKTRSGKIMRRILKKIAEGEYQQLGDISTLTDQNVIQDLIKVASRS